MISERRKRENWFYAWEKLKRHGVGRGGEAERREGQLVLAQKEMGEKKKAEGGRAVEPEAGRIQGVRKKKRESPVCWEKKKKKGEITDRELLSKKKKTCSLTTSSQSTSRRKGEGEAYHPQRRNIRAGHKAYYSTGKKRRGISLLPLLRGD